MRDLEGSEPAEESGNSERRQQALAGRYVALSVGNRQVDTAQLESRTVLRWQNANGLQTCQVRCLEIPSRETDIYANSTLRYVMLVSPDEGSDSNDNGWDHYDGLFWTALLIRPGPAFRNKTFGQLAHLCFPNLKYVVCLSAPSAKAKQNKTSNASAYVSDQNLIAKRDTAAVRKMIFDTLWEVRHGKNVPRSFTDIGSPPVFRADRVNFPDYETILTAVNNLIAKAAMPGAQHFVEPEYRVIGGFDPFRNVASILVDGVTLILNLMTTVNPEAMRSKLRGKVLDLFSLTRRLVAEDHAIYKKTRFQLALDIDFSLNRIPVGIRFFDRVTKWMDDVGDVLDVLPTHN